VPIVGLFTGYFLHPAYRVTRAGTGAAVLRAVKRPAFLESRYAIEVLQPLPEADQLLGVLSLLMLVLLERRRG
jgi:hypothetical protein